MESQQQPGQFKNFLLFMLLSLVIMISWLWLQRAIWPPPPPPEDEPQAKKKVEPPPAKKLSSSDKRRLVKEMSGLMPTTGLDTAVLQIAKAGPPPKKKVKPKPKPTEPLKTVILGDDNFYVRAVLTSRGAGVQRLTLFHFQAADWWGLPVTDDGKPVPIDLIQEDPLNPSFRMYHYPDPKLDKDKRPADTLGQVIWKLEPKLGSRTDEEHTVVFSTPGPAGYEYLKIYKTYTLRPKDYHIGLKIKIAEVGNDADVKRKPFRYQLAGAHGMPIEGGWYSSVQRDALIGIVDNDKDLLRDKQISRQISDWEGGNRVPLGARGTDAIQYAAIGLQYFSSAIVVAHEQSVGNWKNLLAYARPTKESQERRCTIIQVAPDGKSAAVTFLDTNKMEEVIVLPRAKDDLDREKFTDKQKIIANVYTTRFKGKLVVGHFRRGTHLNPALDDITVRVVSEPVNIEPKQSYEHSFLLYHGPVKVRQLSTLANGTAVDYNLAERYAEKLHLETLTDYQSADFWKSIGMTDLIIGVTKAMHWLLNGLFWLVSYINPIGGWLSNEILAIILLTILVRSLMMPVSLWQTRSTMKFQEANKKLQPEIQKIKAKYKDDMQKQQQETWALYKKHNVNPMSGMLGCLPLFLQLPIFIGLYLTLQESIRFRLAKFLWIDNLAAPDMMIWWTQNIPIISDPDGPFFMLFGIIPLGIFYLGPFFNLLPIIAVVMMLVQQSVMMPKIEKPTNEQEEMQMQQQKMMKYMMIFFGVLFYKVAAGLCFYISASILWGMAERKLMPKSKPTTAPKDTPPAGPDAKDGVPASGPKPKPGGRKKGKKRRAKKKEEPKGTMKKVGELWQDILKKAKKK